MGSQCIRFTRLSASVKTTLAFLSVLRYNACVSNAWLLLRFPWYGVKGYAFHTCLCIGSDSFCVLFGIASQCMRFKCVSASSVKTAFVFSFVSRYNLCVSHACLTRVVKTAFSFSLVWCHNLFHALVCIFYDGVYGFLRITLQCRGFTQVSASVKTTSAFCMVWRYNACVSHACLHLFMTAFCVFSSYCVTMQAFYTLVCNG